MKEIEESPFKYHSNICCSQAPLMTGERVNQTLKGLQDSHKACGDFNSHPQILWYAFLQVVEINFLPPEYALSLVTYFSWIEYGKGK